MQHPATPHQVRLALLRAGLNYRAAGEVSCEEMLCLLHHAALEERLRALDAESARLAGLSFADPVEQQRALTAISHRAATELDRFYRPRKSP